MLTTIIKTKNSEDTISETLESVKDLGEVIVIDEHSNDDTILISKEYKAQIMYSSALEFNIAFNQAVSQAQNDWILLLEGNEIVPDKLGMAILNYIEHPKKNKNAVYLQEKLFYLNKEVKGYRRLKLKLFKKGTTELKNNFSTDLKTLKAKKQKLKFGFKDNKNCVLKYEKRNIFTIFQDIVEKNVILSKEIEFKKSSIFLKPFLKFIWIYFFHGALFDGKRGFIYSALCAIDKFIEECNKYEK